MIVEYNGDQIVQDYLSKTLSITRIAKKHGCSTYMVNKILDKYHIERYDYHLVLPQNKVKFPVKEDYFDTENEKMAYILGILASDGTVRKNRNEIKLTLSAVDKEYLETLRNEVGGRDIKEYQDQKGFKNVTWIFTSKRIKEALEKYNIVPEKTYSFTFPKKLNKKYWRDFIRGYFDGDGCISTAGPSAIRFQIGSKTKDVLETIVSYFEECGIPKTQIYKRQDNFYYFQYSSSATR